MTPGTWFVGPPSGTGEPDSGKQFEGKPYRENSVVLTQIGEHNKLVAHIYQGTGGVGSPTALAEQLANARLISAAPELLASLQWCLQFAKRFADEHNDGPTMATCIGQAQYALDKATGGPQ